MYPKLNVKTEDKLALRINEAVAVSGLSRTTLYKLLNEKKLRDVCVAGRRLILREDLERLLQGSQIMSAPEKRSPAPRWRAGFQAGGPSCFPYITTGRCRSIDFELVNRAAVLALPTILARLLPGGRIEHHEYSALNPRRADRRLGSFKIKLLGSNAGRWCDFATGDNGGDPVSLAAFVEGIGQAEAARRLARMVGIDLGEGSR